MKALNIIITGLVILVVGAGAFLGGTSFQKNQDSLEGLAGPALFQKIQTLGGEQASADVLGDTTMGQGQGFFNGNTGSAQGGRPNFAGPGTVGKIIAKTDDTITIELLDGQTKTINITDSTQIRKSVSGTLNDLAMGDAITATGTTAADGGFTASTLQLRDNQTDL